MDISEGTGFSICTPKTKSSQRKSKTRANDHFKKDKYRSYLNVTGPADYNLPILWGNATSSSNMNSSPFYSMAQRCKTPIISKGHTQDIKGIGKF